MNTDRIVTADLYYNFQVIGRYTFLRVKKDKYVLLDDVKSELDLNAFSLKKIRIYDTSGCCYIDKTSIKPYYGERKHKTLSKIKKDYLVDPRNPVGISY